MPDRSFADIEMFIAALGLQWQISGEKLRPIERLVEQIVVYLTNGILYATKVDVY